MATSAIVRPVPQTRRLPVGRTATPILLAAAGLALVAAGAFLPWLSVYAGLTPIPGYAVEGGALAGLAVAATGLLLAGHRLGGAAVLRPAAVLVTLGVAGDAIYSAWRIAGYVADPGPAAALTQPAGGPGALVMAAGALVLACSALTGRLPDHPLSLDGAVRLSLAASLQLAAWIHLLLVPAHAIESPVLGLGFLAAGLAQSLLAWIVLLRRSDATHLAIVGLSAALLALYAWAVVAGLPIGGAELGSHEAAGLQLFAGEPIDLAGAANAIAELLALGFAVRLLGGAPSIDLAGASV